MTFGSNFYSFQVKTAILLCPVFRHQLIARLVNVGHIFHKWRIILPCIQLQLFVYATIFGTKIMGVIYPHVCVYICHVMPCYTILSYYTVLYYAILCYNILNYTIYIHTILYDTKTCGILNHTILLYVKLYEVYYVMLLY